MCSLSLTNLGRLAYIYPEKAMATHSSTLAWKIPWAEEPGRLQSHRTSLSLSLFTLGSCGGTDEWGGDSGHGRETRKETGGFGG